MLSIFGDETHRNLWIMIFPRLFSPTQIGGIEVKNRLVMPAMHTNLGSPEDGISEAGIDFYVARARGGFGQVGVGIIDSFQFGHASPGEFVLHNARHVKVHSRLVQFSLSNHLLHQAKATLKIKVSLKYSC